MDGVDEELRGYTPTIPAHQWAPVKEFVIAAVCDATDDSMPYAPKDLALAAGRLAHWSRTTAAMELDRSVVFDRRSISRFIEVGLPDFNEAARANVRSQLLRMAELLLDPRQAPHRLTPMAAASPSRPYNPNELISLRSWAKSQSTAARRRNGAVLLALGLGAGLSASEIGNLLVADIVRDDDGVSVRVEHGRTRVVPVLHEWEAALIDRKRELQGDRYAFREGHTITHDNLISNFVARSRERGVLPQTQRMRATWVVRHLSLGVPLVALMRSAGVDSLEAFTRYARFVPEIPDSESAALLR